MDVKTKQIQADIINGYTLFECNFLGKDLYLKHLDNQISAQIERAYEGFYARAVQNGTLTEDQKLAFLNEQGIWTTKDTAKIDEQISFLERLKITKTKVFLKAALDEVKWQINGVTKEIETLQAKKNDFIGLTAERYAEKRANDYYIYYSSFADEKLTEKLFTKFSFDELESHEIAEVVGLFIRYSSIFKVANLKKVALTPAFLNFFYLCEDNPFTFFGKPIAQLTNNQAEIFGYAKYFKHIFSESQGSIPKEVQNDAEKLCEWFESNRSAKEALAKIEDKDNLNVSLVGATKEDLQNLGLSTENKTASLQDALAKKGGSMLTMEELMSMQGV